MKIKPILPVLLTFGVVSAADLPPDKGDQIPASAKRETVVQLDTANAKRETIQADLPADYRLERVAAAPLVTHPIAGCLDDRGRLFLGDAVGVNWYKAQLEANPPNRVLMLEDINGDGVFDKSTVFADKMTFPQGAQWLDGSLYVASPPGIWKLTDTDNDGVADQRSMIVTGFDYTGNAADVHGPFLHPGNGRLYWCHGRKGYKIPDSQGRIVHEGKSSGIWSCLPNGEDVQWHSLLAGDNPVEVDFTPDGDVIGVQNLYFSQPRGDTLMHWLYGGVYSRVDQMKVIEGLPTTLETMPVMHNFGHVAVSGCCFWRGYQTNADNGKQGANVASGGIQPLQFMVTHFNTQRVVRMELSRDGSTYRAVENEFLKLHNPDIHFTDVLEDPHDGSLLVLDTGGWFRIGCPSSLMAKAEVLGAIYRITGRQKKLSVEGKWSVHAARPLPPAELVRMLAASDPVSQRHACDAVAQMKSEDLGQHVNEVHQALLKLLNSPLDPALEHAAMNAYYRQGYDLKNQASSTLQMRRILQAQSNHRLGYDKGPAFHSTMVAVVYLDAEDAELRQTAREVLLNDPKGDQWIPKLAGKILNESAPRESSLETLRALAANFASTPNGQKLIGEMIAHSSAAVRQAVVELLATQSTVKPEPAWGAPLMAMLEDGSVRLPVLLDAIKRLKLKAFDGKLEALSKDASQPAYIRLKALDAMVVLTITRQAFTLVYNVLTCSDSSASARIQAATMLGRAGALTKEELMTLAQAFAVVGPVELKELLPAIRSCKKVDVVRAMTIELARNPSLVSLQESLYRSALADKPTEIFETVLLPAYRKGIEAIEAKRRLLVPLAEKAAAKGDAKAGLSLFASGRGTCIACHKIGDLGRPIGPDLSKIGAIRTERDLIESILFPSNTLARDYEAHVVELRSGETIMGLIRSHTAEGLLIVDVAGQETNVPHDRIVADTILPTSLMPMGLDGTMAERELLDLVAYLRSLR